MFGDFFKNTTNEEKKEVVKNAGTYFPADHSNKIKGIDQLAEAVVENAMKKQDEIVNKRTTAAAYTTKNCEKCGKEFQCYRNRSKYCKECAAEQKELTKKITPRIRENALARARKRGTTYELELTKILKGYDPLRRPNKNAKINTMTFEDFRKANNKTSADYRDRNNVIETAVGKASQKERAVASKRAYRNNTGYLYELNKIVTGTKPIRKYGGSKPKTAMEEQVQVTQEEQVEQTLEEIEAVHEFDYLDTLELAIEIVRGVKGEEDVKLAVDKVFETLKYHLTK